MKSVIAITTIRTPKWPATIESTLTELHARKTIMPIQTGTTGQTKSHVHGHRRAQAVAPEVPFDYRDERVLVTGDAMDFEAAARHFALEISALAGTRPSPLSRRLDDLLEDARGMRGAHWRREFELAKWRAEILAQPTWFEIGPGDSLGCKHDPMIVTEAHR